MVSRITSVGILALLIWGCSRQEGKYVAEVLDARITVEQFQERYRDYLHQTSSRDNILLRKRILDNMINEVLIFQDLKRQGFSDDGEAQEEIEKIRTQQYLLEYAKRITIDTVSVTEKELEDEFQAYNTKVTTRFVYGKTEDEAWNLRRQLERGATFEKLARSVFEDPGLANNGGYLGTFGYGEMEPALERTAFMLPPGQLSEPVKLSMGYAIVKVETRTRNPLASEYDFQKVKEKLTRNIRERKALELLNVVSHRIAEEVSAVFNEEALEYVFANWGAITAESAVHRTSERGSQRPTGMSSMTLVSFHDDAWTVSDLFEKSRRTTERQRQRVRTIDDVKNFILGLVARETILERARRDGVDRDAAVQKRIDKLTTEYLLKRWMRLVQDTVGRSGWDDHILRSFYDQRKDLYAIPPEFNVAEILVRTEAEAKGIVGQLRRGADFADLARKKSIRTWAAKRGGELGFGSMARYGILGDKFFSAKVGELIGPEYVDPYYGVFKVLARREGQTCRFEDARNDVIQDITAEKKREVFKQCVADLRRSVAVRVYDDVLENVYVQ